MNKGFSNVLTYINLPEDKWTRRLDIVFIIGAGISTLISAHNSWELIKNIWIELLVWSIFYFLSWFNYDYKIRKKNAKRLKNITDKTAKEKIVLEKEVPFDAFLCMVAWWLIFLTIIFVISIHMRKGELPDSYVAWCIVVAWVISYIVRCICGVLFYRNIVTLSYFRNEIAYFGISFTTLSFVYLIRSGKIDILSGPSSLVGFVGTCICFIDIALNAFCFLRDIWNGEADT